MKTLQSHLRIYKIYEFLLKWLKKKKKKVWKSGNSLGSRQENGNWRSYETSKLWQYIILYNTCVTSANPFHPVT